MLFFLVMFSTVYSGAVIIQEKLIWISDSFLAVVLSDLLVSLAYIVSFLAPVWFFFAISRKKVVHPMGLALRFFKQKPTQSTFAIMFFGTAVCFSMSYFNSVLFSIPQDIYDQLFVSEGTTGYQLVLMFISTAIVPAFVEEFLFRGVVLSQIRPYSETGAVLISALLFGLMHQTPFQILYTTALGIVLGVVCIKTGSIWCGVILHFFNNFLSVFQSFLLERYNEETGNIIYSVMMLSVILLSFLLGATLFIAGKKSTPEKVKRTAGYFKSVEGYEGMMLFKRENILLIKAFFTPTMIIYIVLCIISIFSTALLVNGVVI